MVVVDDNEEDDDDNDNDEDNDEDVGERYSVSEDLEGNSIGLRQKQGFFRQRCQCPLGRSGERCQLGEYLHLQSFMYQIKRMRENFLCKSTIPFGLFNGTREMLEVADGKPSVGKLIVQVR